ncbi:MAG TPA: hypothetical protein VHX61_12030 [Rhizomicrobium sp.]|jgi:hypothetical protein|nr:hypothetical protein [Rhizomicrobium sp.]
MPEPVITIAGRAWRIPLLAPRQNRVVIAGLMDLGGRPEAQYDTLLDIVFAALTRAHPALAREEFDDWPIATWELLDALPVIAKQTGFLRGAAIRAETRIELPDWDAVIAQFVNFLPGTTWDYWEDALTAPRLEAMREEWRKHLPLPVLAAAWLGYKPRPRDGEALEELLRLFPNGKLRLN